MVFHTGFGLSIRSMAAHSDKSGEKFSNIFKSVTLGFAVLVLYKNICLKKKLLKGNYLLNFPFSAEKPVNSLFVAPAVTPVKDVWQIESNNPGVRLYQYDLFDYSLLVSKDFKALFKTL